jgi:hypothetical protein
MLFCGALLPAQPVTWLPLMEGSQWVYRASWRNATQVRVEVTGKRQVDGREYYVVTGWPGRGWETLLRQDGGGRIWELVREGSHERLFLDANTEVGREAGNAGDHCTGSGILAERPAKAKTVLGDFDYGAKVQYNVGPCADAGVQSDTWLPWVGLIQREFITIAGPRTYELVYARLGDVTVITAPELSFQIALDKTEHVASDVLPAVIGAEPVLHIRLALRNTTDTPVLLEFPSGQDFDIVLRNEKGDEVRRWSDGRAFPAIVRQERFTGERVWLAELVLQARDGTALPAGNYRIEAEITTRTRTFSAASPLRVVRPN